MANVRKPMSKKRKYQSFEEKPFPIDCNLIGYFTGLDVEIFDENSIKTLANCGCFGEDSRPRQMISAIEKSGIEKMTKAMYEQKLKWREKFGSSQAETKIISVDGKEKEDPFIIENTRALFPEEAMFLHKELNCLEIRNAIDGKSLSTLELWKEFCELNESFPSHYAAYVYLKSKNWVIKLGSKFGGIFLLYKQGPAFYHATYIVKLVVNERIDMLEFKTHERVAENTKKQMLYLEINFPDDLDPLSIENLHKFTVREAAFQRKILTTY
ncbi:hypothetical protein PVAND_005148 [Polypedilum vanderplanki]|uniref:tRNA-intron lyase n=1 Tax=Polypedilum vanderplanki TaxID=319348 RepID=A0A9J6BZY5_POLVA|nr:hypothetical protein PVAND_005148 [Polypedilum vanderplanki]